MWNWIKIWRSDVGWSWFDIDSLCQLDRPIYIPGVNASSCKMPCLNLLNTSSAIVMLMYTCDSELIESAWMFHLWAAEERWVKYGNCMFLHTRNCVEVSMNSCTPYKSIINMHVRMSGGLYALHANTNEYAATNTHSIHIIHNFVAILFYFSVCWSWWMKVKCF